MKSIILGLLLKLSLPWWGKKKVMWNKYKRNIGNKTNFKYYGQYYEDYIIDNIFKKIGYDNRIVVDIGANTMIGSNSLYFIKHENFKGYLFDMIFIEPISNATIYKKKVTPENINKLLNENNIFNDFDLLSIDIDSLDFWIWEKLNYSPKIVIIEFNIGLLNVIPLTVKYQNYKKKHNSYFGANLYAFFLLGKQKGYELHYIIRQNCIFVKKEYSHLLDKPINKEVIKNYLPVSKKFKYKSSRLMNMEWTIPFKKFEIFIPNKLEKYINYSYLKNILL